MFFALVLLPPIKAGQGFITVSFLISTLLIKIGSSGLQGKYVEVIDKSQNQLGQSPIIYGNGMMCRNIFGARGSELKAELVSVQGRSVNRDLDNRSNRIMVQNLLSTEWAVSW